MKQAVQAGTKGPQIPDLGPRGAFEHLGRNVAGRSGRTAGAARPAPAGVGFQARQAHPVEPDVTVSVAEQIGRSEVGVNHPVAVQGGQPACRLLGGVADHAGRQPSAGFEGRGQRAAFHPGGDQPGPAVGYHTGVQHRHQIRVRGQLPQDGHLGQKPASGPVVRKWNDLEGDPLGAVRMPGLPGDASPARSGRARFDQTGGRQHGVELRCHAI